jgi:DeoR/GlpR family transcriptional regulator of sugar metabolism
MLVAIENGETDVKVLAERFEVSPSTVRRDLQRLSGKKKIMRTYGGAILAPPVVEESLPIRESLNYQEKERIARTAADFVRDGETLILDGGSTVGMMGQFLSGKRLTVITNNIKLASYFADDTRISTVLLGGTIRSLSLSTCGPLAEDNMRWMSAARYFTSANGVVPGRGLCEATIEQISLKRLMMRQAQETFVLADASKIGFSGQPFWLELNAGWTLISTASAEACKPFERDGAKIIFA